MVVTIISLFLCVQLKGSCLMRDLISKPPLHVWPYDQWNGSESGECPFYFIRGVKQLGLIYKDTKAQVISAG